MNADAFEHCSQLKRISLHGLDYIKYAYDAIKKVKLLEILSAFLFAAFKSIVDFFIESIDGFPHLKELCLFNISIEWNAMKKLCDFLDKRNNQPFLKLSLRKSTLEGLVDVNELKILACFSEIECKSASYKTTISLSEIKSVIRSLPMTINSLNTVSICK